MSIKVTVDPTRGLVQQKGDPEFVISEGVPVVFESSASIAYTPSNPADWSSAPSDLIQAVDYLAAGSGSGGGGGAVLNGTQGQVFSRSTIT
jgi:hypothetical protein